VSLLTVIGIMGVAFAFSLHLETQATRQFVSATQARYLAESGVSHARALLDEDRLSSRVDELSEPWAEDFKGREADVDGEGTPESRWWPVADADDAAVGRYAVIITDECGKVNLNAAQAHPSGTGLGAINLTTLLEQAGIRRAAEVAEAIEQARYGDDQRPGVAGADDDADGSIDEPDEYQPLALRGDDRLLESLESLASVAGLTGEEIRQLSQVATVYSWDLNVGVSGRTRVNVNTATAEELLASLLDAGVADPWQAAVNMADFADADVEISRVTKSSKLYAISNQGPLGSWTWSADPTSHYETEEAGGEALMWTFSAPSGTFRVLARGVPGVKVGDLVVAGRLVPSARDGQSLGLMELAGEVAVEVVNREPAGTRCAFRGLELVSEEGQAGDSTVVRGIEAVRFNELMIEPTREFPASSAAFDSQGSGWACLGEGVCTNSGVGQARWSWTSAALKPGRYYVWVFGSAPGQTVGDVRVESGTQRLVHGQVHPSTLRVGSDGKVTLTIGKSAADGTYYFQKIVLSLQPDAEYVELINLSDRDIEVGGWTIEGELTGGRRARLPSGARIKAHGLLVAAVDLSDTQEGIAGNGIDAQEAWELPEEGAVQLEFLEGGPSVTDDWLKTTVPGGGAPRLVLRAQERLVDEVEYPTTLPTSAFQSLEKGDPSTIGDSDGDGIDDQWYPSLALTFATPGLTNDNNGTREQVGLDVITHDALQDVRVRNRPLEGVGELAGLSSGAAWKPFATEDLANVVDRFTVEGLRLEAEGRLIAGDGAWQERADGAYEHNSTAEPAVTGAWAWDGITAGFYRLSVYGRTGEQLAIRWKLDDGSFTAWSPALSTDAQGRIALGQLVIGPQAGEPEAGSTPATPPNTLMLEATCATLSGICHLDYVRLDPRLIRVGPVNVNTAPFEVLLALPGMTEAKVARIIAGRPYGDQDEQARGIGDLLLGEILGADEETTLGMFQRLAHLLTTRSELFHLQSLGQAVVMDRAVATQRILTVVERR